MAAGPNSASDNPTRSIRFKNETWDRAARRAATEGTTPSRVCQLLLEGYAKGLVDLPRVTVQYGPKK